MLVPTSGGRAAELLPESVLLLAALAFHLHQSQSGRRSKKVKPANSRALLQWCKCGVNPRHGVKYKWAHGPDDPVALRLERYPLLAGRYDDGTFCVLWLANNSTDGPRKWFIPLMQVSAEEEARRVVVLGNGRTWSERPLTVQGVRAFVQAYVGRLREKPAATDGALIIAHTQATNCRHPFWIVQGLRKCKPPPPVRQNAECLQVMWDEPTTACMQGWVKSPLAASFCSPACNLPSPFCEVLSLGVEAVPGNGCLEVVIMRQGLELKLRHKRVHVSLRADRRGMAVWGVVGYPAIYQQTPGITRMLRKHESDKRQPPIGPDSVFKHFVGKRVTTRKCADFITTYWGACFDLSDVLGGELELDPRAQVELRQHEFGCSGMIHMLLPVRSTRPASFIKRVARA